MNPTLGEWANFANCLGVDPELFFPGSGVNPSEAKAVCAACPVRRECLNHAIANDEHYGIWGGLSQRERARVRRMRRPLRSVA